MRSHSFLVPISLALVVLIWGLNTVAVKALYQHISPVAYLGTRFLTLLPLVYLLARFTGHKIELKEGTLKQLLAASLLGFGIPQLLGYIALDHTSAFASSLIGATSPIATLAICAVMRYETVTGARWLGAFICITGLLIFQGCFTGTLTTQGGEGMALAAAVMASIHTVMVGRLVRHYHPILLLFWIMTLSALMITPFCLASLLAQSWSAVTIADWSLILGSAILPILVGHPLWHWAIKHLGAGASSLWVLLCPLVAGTFSVIFLGAKVYPHETLGALVALSGLLLSQLPREKMLKAVAYLKRARS